SLVGRDLHRHQPLDRILTREENARKCSFPQVHEQVKIVQALASLDVLHLRLYSAVQAGGVVNRIEAEYSLQLVRMLWKPDEVVLRRDGIPRAMAYLILLVNQVRRKIARKLNEIRK